MPIYDPQNNVTSVFFQSMEALSPFESNPTLAIAVSGGADSMALSLLAYQWATKNKGKIIALTFDHQLRPESKTEAKQVSDWLSPLGIEHQTLMANTHPAEKNGNIQEQARLSRYSSLLDWCRRHHILHLLTGHHQNDQAETLLMRLQRGSGVDGLASIPPVSNRKNVRLLRPLLSLSHKQLCDWLQQHQQQWIEDPSNHNTRYTRTRMRMLLKDASISDHLLTSRLAETATQMQMAQTALRQQLYRAMATCLSLYPEGYAKLDIKLFTRLPQEIALRLLANTLTTVSGRNIPPRIAKIRNLHLNIKHSMAVSNTAENSLSSNYFNGMTLHGCVINADNNTSSLIIARELSAIPPQTMLEINTTSSIWDGRFRYTLTPLSSASLEEKNPHHGTDNNHYIAPLSPSGWQQIKETTDNILPKHVLYGLPAVKKHTKDIEFVCSVPHIGYNARQIGAPEMIFSFAPQVPLTR